ncbi:MAG TPA: TraR/DksA C4-type zinc finger protein, partial [Methylomirabilota bacterium]|nr:TraR/DksA C4-type zinc finger protein [Methylomirabilota bacterium]
MNDIRRELEQELKHTVDRLKGLGGAIAFEDDPGAREDEGQGEAAGDAGRISEDREMTFAVRGLLVERANRLAEALDRVRSGEYGVCEVCDEPIAPARLRAIPEVTTCVACQDAEER